MARTIMTSRLLPTCLVLVGAFWSGAPHAHDLPDQAGFTVDLALAATYRGDNQLTDAQREREDPWQIPGLLMGGHATPWEKGFSLDEVSIWAAWRSNLNNYAAIKVGSHDHGHGFKLEFEEAYLGQILTGPPWSPRVEAGKMVSNFSPDNHAHPSNRLFSRASLGHDAFYGRHLDGLAARLLLGDERQGFSGGLEHYWRPGFPADRAGHLQNVYVRHARQHFNLDWRAQGWLTRATAKDRRDDRLHDHVHETIGLPAQLDTRFDGDTRAGGLFAEVGWTWDYQKRVSLTGEWMRTHPGGTVRDENRRLELQGRHWSLRLEPRLRWGAHEIGLRYETLRIKNHLAGPAATMLGEDAGLINQGHDPQRLSLSWRWQVRPDIALRLEWIRDDSLPRRRDVAGVGVIWQHALLR